MTGDGQNKVFVRTDSRRAFLYSFPGIMAVFDGAVLAGGSGMAPARNRPSNRIEILIGRSAALCIHPLAAWRSRSRTDRALLLISYVAISYVVVLGLLHAMAA